MFLCHVKTFYQVIEGRVVVLVDIVILQQLNASAISVSCSILHTDSEYERTDARRHGIPSYDTPSDASGVMTESTRVVLASIAAMEIRSRTSSWEFWFPELGHVDDERILDHILNFVLPVVLELAI
jgi:hypothetical protein